MRTRGVRRGAPSVRWWGLIAGLTLLTLSCSPAHQGAGGGVGSGTNVSVKGLTLSPDLVSAYFPVSGVELNRPSAIQRLADGRYQETFAACFRQRGFPAETGPLGGEIHYMHMPDLPYMQVHGFDIPGVPVTIPQVDYAKLSQGEKDAREQAGTACSAAARRTIQAFKDRLDPLFGRWQAAIEGLQGDDTVIKAYAGFVTCLHEKGINVPDEDGFFRYSDAIVFAGNNPTADQAAHKLQVARVYVTCITPVENARIALRTSYRQTFFSDNADALRGLQQTANDLLRTTPTGSPTPNSS